MSVDLPPGVTQAALDAGLDELDGPPAELVRCDVCGELLDEVEALDHEVEHVLDEGHRAGDHADAPDVACGACAIALTDLAQRAGFPGARVVGRGRLGWYLEPRGARRAVALGRGESTRAALLLLGAAVMERGAVPAILQ